MSREELRRHLRKIIQDHTDRTIEEMGERLAEVDDEEDARRLLSEWVAPLLDEIELLKASLKDDRENQ